MKQATYATEDVGKELIGEGKSNVATIITTVSIIIGIGALSYAGYKIYKYYKEEEQK